MSFRKCPSVCLNVRRQKTENAEEKTTFWIDLHQIRNKHKINLGQYNTPEGFLKNTYYILKPAPILPNNTENHTCTVLYKKTALSL